MHEATRRRPPERIFRSYADKRELLGMAMMLGQQAPKALGLSTAQLSHIGSEVHDDAVSDAPDNARDAFDEMLQDMQTTKYRQHFWKKTTKAQRRLFYERFVGLPISEAARRYDISPPTIYRICREFEGDNRQGPAPTDVVCDAPTCSSPEPGNAPPPTPPPSHTLGVELTDDEVRVLKEIGERVMQALVRRALQP